MRLWRNGATVIVAAVLASTGALTLTGCSRAARRRQHRAPGRRRCPAGEIVLMHVGSDPDDHTTLDASALPSVIDRLRPAGYRFVTLDALLS